MRRCDCCCGLERWDGKKMWRHSEWRHPTPQETLVSTQLQGLFMGPVSHSPNTWYNKGHSSL